MTHIIVGMSGGVDSSLTAALLIEQGYSVEGLFMFNWAQDEDAYCTAAEDYAVAAEVASDLGIKLHRADFSREYRERVFAHFLDEYRRGRTPSPDLLCNREIKFREFLNYALQLGADAIATGHYARVEQTTDRARLLLAVDQNKDQTYFLSAVDGEAFRRVLFPLGAYTKPQVREMAQQRGLVNYQRKDSTGICFIGERPMREFLGRYMEAQRGRIVDDGGHDLGEHPGLCFFTIGQRKGLGIGGQKHASDAPWYVYGKDIQSGTLQVTQNEQHPALHCHVARLETPHWLHPTLAPKDGWRGHARIRHRQALQPCRLQQDEGGQLLCRFDSAQWAIAPGQSAVFYDGDECIGSAVIESGVSVEGLAAAVASGPEQALNPL